jgi:hypothetical protein
MMLSISVKKFFSLDGQVTTYLKRTLYITSDTWDKDKILRETIKLKGSINGQKLLNYSSMLKSSFTGNHK